MLSLDEKIAGEIVMAEKPGSAMKKWRLVFKASQRDVARAMGVSPSMISDYESGRRRSPGAQFIRRFVGALLIIDEERGGEIRKRYSMVQSDAIISIGEFSEPVPGEKFLSIIGGRDISGVAPKREIFGYTIIDSIKAIVSLDPNDYLQIYGWSTERALIFTGVKYGRSPMIAVRTHMLKPAMVVYHRPQSVDNLAIKLARIEGIPLVVTDLSLDMLKKSLEDMRIK
ncbi:MAG: transcriptional regulator [Thermoplasmata archaeon]|nr:MAG: transcriptional regulator [Thermoplasmata archaeon]